MNTSPIILLGSHRSAATRLGDVLTEEHAIGRTTPSAHAPQPAATGSRHVS